MMIMMLLVAALLGPGDVCDGLDSGKIDVPDGIQSVTVTAPDGFLIGGYCVKAGSSKQGDGPVYVVIDPGVTEVTISHPSGKDVSHYSVAYTKEDPPSSTTTIPPTTTTSSTTTSSTTTTPTTTTVTTVPSSSTSTTATESPATTTVTSPPSTVTVTSTSVPPTTPTMTELPKTGPTEILLVLASGGLAFLVLGGLFLRAGRRER